ncbi:MAG: phasin family protein [Candidatus Pacebacteria bacterium]|nr:phasin family protein [Candidatus Paceibacterota bacterium]
MTKGLLEKIILSGLGLASLSQDKAQKMIDELVKEGEVSQKDGAIMVKKIMDGVEKNKKEIEKMTEKAVREVVTKINVPSKKDISALEKKIDDLNKKLDGKKPEVKK